jgi:predicted Fe-Mo cluster-binding NifX family protein
LARQLLTIFLMRVAIAHWQGRIAPVFDVAGNLLLVDVEAGIIQGRHSVSFKGESFRERVRKLAESGVDVLICGAISWPLEAALRTARIKVFHETCGEVESVLESFIRGRLPEQAFLKPGSHGRTQAARRRYRGGGKKGRQTPRTI